MILKGYKSYAWVAPGDSRLNPQRKDKVYGKLIVQSADSELQKKGMSVDVNTPDALFLFETKVEEVAETSQAPVADNGVGYGYGYAGPGYYVGGVPSNRAVLAPHFMKRVCYTSICMIQRRVSSFGAAELQNG